MNSLCQLRMLIDGGWSAELQLEFANLFPDISHAPPAAKRVVNALPKHEPENEGMLLLRHFRTVLLTTDATVKNVVCTRTI